MKTTMLIVGAMATAAAAQDLSGFNTLPGCGQTCITNMISQATELGCTGSDVACLCLEPNFSYGIRDCTDESCPDNQDARDTQSWAVGICANQGIAVTSASSDPAASTGSDATPTGDESAGAGGSVTSSFTTVISSGGSVITTVLPTVVPIETGSSGASSTGDSSTGGSSTGASTGASSTGASSTGVVRTSTTATTTAKPSQTSNGGDNGNGGSDNSTDTPDAARATAVPIGIMAFAGVAALLL